MPSRAKIDIAGSDAGFPGRAPRQLDPVLVGGKGTLDDGARALPTGGVGPEAATWSDRYRVLRELGRGGMGITYVAHDRELDREVAFKLVRPDAGGIEGGQLRLHREAQALARLAHPNIVAVYDVGTHQGRGYIAMELVKGQTLDARQLATTHSWREVLGIFQQVGAGLQAAHAAGLVHRDVKPSNIMLGHDGRVRLLDFGLAQPGDRPGRASAARAGAPPGEEMDEEMDEEVGGPDALAGAGGAFPLLTSTGAMVGTPGYMAPEQIDGHLADARSDQFSFCVSLFEALHGERPFFGKNVRMLRALMYHGVIRELPDRGRVPGWLHAIVVRGLSFDPAARWPSMDALLAALALGARPRPAWWRIGGLIGLCMGAATAAALTYGVGGGQTGAGMCTGASAQIEEAWNDSQRAAVARAIHATGSAHAAEAWQRTQVLLDRYAEEWVEAATDACEAATATDEWGDERLVQLQCLTERRRSLRVLAGELGHLDGKEVSAAIQAAGRLPRISTCADRDYLRTRIKPPEDERVAEQVEILRATTTRADELQKLGNYEEALAIALPVLETATALGYAPLEAEARVRLGDLLEKNGDYQEAEDQLRAAYFLARTLAHRAVAYEAASLLVVVLGNRMARYDEAQEWGRHARAELVGTDSDLDRASLLFHLGQALWKQGRYEEAAAHQHHARIIRERLLGPVHPDMAASLNGLGEVERLRGRHDEAASYYRQAIAVYEQTLGEDYPRLAYPLHNLGLVYSRQGRHHEAAAHFHRAWTVWEHALGPEHIEVAYPLLGLATSYLHLGRPADALPLARRVLALRERHRVAPPELAEARFVLARALMNTAGATGNRAAERALELARQAHAGLHGTSTAELQLAQREIEDWLAEHDRTGAWRQGDRR
jgi:tetratricopeptide (TPR) repeat protein